VEIIKHAIKEDGKVVGKGVFFFSWNNTLEPYLKTFRLMNARGGHLSKNL
jgi:hypothetical protein